MKTAKLFKNGQSQAVRLPKEFRVAGTEVYIKKQGEAIVLLPKEKSWKPLFDSLNHFEKDFKIERNYPGEDQKREPMFQWNMSWTQIFAAFDFIYVTGYIVCNIHLIYLKSKYSARKSTRKWLHVKSNFLPVSS